MSRTIPFLTSFEDFLVPFIVLVFCAVLAYLVYRKSNAIVAPKKKLKKKDPLIEDPPKKLMSVVGIDFGNLNTVVAVARNRGIDVITNEVSNRATPSLVSFGEKQRYLGESAKTQEISNFKSTVASIKRLIGRSWEDVDIIQQEQPFVNFKLVKGERGDVAAHVTYQSESRTFSMTQIAAMFFNQVKDFTSKEIKIPCTDCVISCPGWFTDAQRRAILDASEIAGLNCVRIMNDLTASALGYGITKLDLPDTTLDPKVKPRNVVFVDMGNSSYQVAVVSLVKGKLIVKSTAYDRNLGGRNFDEVLVNHYVEEFNKKYKLDIRSNPKALFRLRQSCEKVKKILSANAVTMLNIECLMDDKDVSAEVHREEFLEWIKPLTSRLAEPLSQALAAADMTVDDIDFVELVGGSTRLAAVKDFLNEFFRGKNKQSKISTTLNLDEAVARGCALQCAIISPVFKVRDFSVQDWNGYPIELSWDPSQVPPSKAGESNSSSMAAFNIGNVIPNGKVLTLYRSLNENELAQSNGHLKLDLEAKYDIEAAKSRGLPHVPQGWIGKFSLSGIKKLNDDSKATIRIKARLDGNNLVSVEAAQQLEEVLVPEEPEKKDEKKEDKKDDKEEKTESTPMETEASAVAPKMKRVTRKHELHITSHTSAASRELIKEWHAAECEMNSSDRLVIDTAEKRNQLEEYVYYARGKLEMAWSEYMIDAERTPFLARLNEMEDWLYGDGEEATKSVYAEKLAELESVGSPVAARYLESEERPRAERLFHEYANSVLLNLSAQDGRYDHIPKADVEKVSKQVNEKLQWLNSQISKVNAQPKHVDPVVTVSQINSEKEALERFVTPLLNKPKPVPKTEEKREDEKMDISEKEPASAAEDKKEGMEID